MEQLSNCLELGIKKYDVLVGSLNNQGFIVQKTMEKIDDIYQLTNLKNWTEIGFYIFAGFISGVLTGVLSIIAINWCFKKTMINTVEDTMKHQDLGMLDLTHAISTPVPPNKPMSNTSDPDTFESARSDADTVV